MTIPWIMFCPLCKFANSIKSLPSENQIVFCRHCLHAMVFKEGAFHEFMDETFNLTINPNNAEFVKYIRDLQEELGRQLGMWG